MSYDLVIKNGVVVTAVSSYAADVAIQGEQIAAVGRDLAGRRQIDAGGKLVIPGGVDIHVHLEMPIGDFTSTDNFFHGTKAAAFGGTTAVIDFVEAEPDETMVAAIEKRRALADPNVVIDYGLHMTIGPHDVERLEQVGEAFAAGCTTFKLYMAYGLRLRDGELLRALMAVGDVNGLPVVHAENWDVITTLIEQNLAAGRTEPRWHPRSRPAALEAEATGRLIDIAALADVPVHVFHVSAAETVERIAAARAAGRPVTGETCPQYLYLNWDVFEAAGVAGALPVCSPPIREASQGEALWAALARGDLQLVTTDHCPFTEEEKATGLEDYSRIPGGVPSIEMRVSAVYQAVRDGRLTPEQWVDRCAATPARLVGLTNKGHIAPGYDADIVIWDPDKTLTLSPETLHETADWTPYEGLELTGWPQTTLVRGQAVVEDGRFTGGAGEGRFVHREEAGGR